MITLFTTTKDFEGVNRTNQLNANRSWLSSSYSPQVVIFGTSKGVEELGTHPNLTYRKQVKVTDTGAPFGDEMFTVINKIAKYPICCYINADIILTNKFFETVRLAHTALQRAWLHP